MQATEPGPAAKGPTPPPPRKVPSRPQVITWQGIVIGVGAFLVIFVIAFFWRLSVSSGLLQKIREFEFTVEEPVAEDFSLSDPQRDIIKELPEEVPRETEPDERPNIQMAVTPVPVQVPEEIVKSPNVEVETPEINPAATQIDIDAAQEISETSEMVTYAVNPIAVTVTSAGDIFKYAEPTPENKPQLYYINRAPRAARTLEKLPKAFGDQEALATGEMGPANINLWGTGDFFRTMTRFGGVEARSAVDAALHWLAIHQEPSGVWLAQKYEGEPQADTAVTGLAVLAFMGGGHTIRKGEYRRNVMRGLEELIRRQKDDGEIDKNIYCHSIATIALCEAYGRARDERIGLVARKAADYLEKAVNPDGGWRYTARCGVSDFSVTGWAMMALKTARLADIKFDTAVYARGLSFLDSVTDHGGSAESNGVVTYQYAADQVYDSNGHPALTAAGMMVRQFSGVGVKSNLLMKGADLTRQLPPDWRKKDFYLWYYATYAMHNMGGEHRVWWNRRIRDVLIENQCKEGDNAGSWDPENDHWGSRGGRVYTTALGALCLEVYYRYSDALTSFGVAPDLDDLFLQ